MGPVKGSSNEPYDILGTSWEESLGAIIFNSFKDKVSRVEVWLKGYIVKEDHLFESQERLKYAWGVEAQPSQFGQAEILSRAGRCIGRLTVWPDRSPSAADQNPMRDCARWIAAVYEVHRRFEAVVRVMRVVTNSQRPEEILKELLTVSAWLLRADRGDLTWRRRPSLNLMLRVGPPTISDSIPENSVTQIVMRGRTRRLIPDVRIEPDYSECHEDTCSLIAIPLLSNRGDLSGDAGVLKLEWFTPYPVHQEDASNLEHLWNLVSPSVEAVHVRAALSDLLNSYNAKRADGLSIGEDLLDATLAKIESVSGLDSGVIWVLDQAGTHLECEWVRTPLSSGKQEGLRLSASEGSFAAAVFNAGDSKCTEDDSRLDRIAHAALRAIGEITGIRLESAGKAWGVLAVWDSAGRERQPRNLARLREFAVPIALGLSYSRHLARRYDFEQDLARLLRNMQERPDIDRIFLPILQQILKLGFRTARAFQYSEGEQADQRSFRLVRAAPDMEGFPPIVLTQNRWAMDLKQYADEAIRGGQVCLPRRSVDSEACPNPVSLLLNRKPGTPWIEIPLVVNGRFYGYIAADRSGESSREELDELALLGVLAAQALAPAQMVSDQLSLMDHVLHKAMQSSAGSNEELQLWVTEGDLERLAKWVRQDNAYLKRIKRRAVQALNILRRGNLEYESFPATDAVENAVRDFMEELPTADVDVAIDPKHTGAEIKGIRMEIESAVDNMLTNAFNAAPGKPIKLSFEREQNEITIAVSDAGPGMTIEQFEERRAIYRRGVTARPPGRQSLGLGLGLFLLDQVAKSYGGILETDRVDDRFVMKLRLRTTRIG